MTASAGSGSVDPPSQWMQSLPHPLPPPPLRRRHRRHKQPPSRGVPPRPQPRAVPDLAGPVGSAAPALVHVHPPPRPRPRPRKAVGPAGRSAASVVQAAAVVVAAASSSVRGQATPGSTTLRTGPTRGQRQRRRRQATCTQHPCPRMPQRPGRHLLPPPSASRRRGTDPRHTTTRSCTIRTITTTRSCTRTTKRTRLWALRWHLPRRARPRSRSTPGVGPTQLSPTEPSWTGRCRATRRLIIIEAGRCRGRPTPRRPPGWHHRSRRTRPPTRSTPSSPSPPANRQGRQRQRRCRQQRCPRPPPGWRATHRRSSGPRPPTSFVSWPAARFTGPVRCARLGCWGRPLTTTSPSTSSRWRTRAGWEASSPADGQTPA